MSNNQIAAIRARLNFGSVEEFIRAFAPLISAGGMFLRTKQVKPVGSTIRFDFSLSSGERLLFGEGVVRQVKQPTPEKPNVPSGMLVKFTKLNRTSKELISRIVAYKQAGESSSATPRAATPAPRPPEPTPAPAPAPEPTPPPVSAVPDPPPPVNEPPLAGAPPSVDDEMEVADHDEAPRFSEESLAAAAQAQGAVFEFALDEDEIDDVLGSLFGGGGASADDFDFSPIGGGGGESSFASTLDTSMVEAATEAPLAMSPDPAFAVVGVEPEPDAVSGDASLDPEYVAEADAEFAAAVAGSVDSGAEATSNEQDVLSADPTSTPEPSQAQQSFEPDATPAPSAHEADPESQALEPRPAPAAQAPPGEFFEAEDSETPLALFGDAAAARLAGISATAPEPGPIDLYNRDAVEQPTGPEADADESFGLEIGSVDGADPEVPAAESTEDAPNQDGPRTVRGEDGQPLTTGLLHRVDISNVDFADPLPEGVEADVSSQTDSTDEEAGHVAAMFEEREAEAAADEHDALGEDEALDLGAEEEDALDLGAPEDDEFQPAGDDYIDPFADSHAGDRDAMHEEQAEDYVDLGAQQPDLEPEHDDLSNSEVHESLSGIRHAPEEPSGELGGLLDELQGRAEPTTTESGLLDLQLSDPGRTEEPEQDVPKIGRGEDPSLADLLSLAHKDIETKKEEVKSGDAILDEVLGGDLPPPPDENPFAAAAPAETAEKPKKKKGFLRRLFGGDS